MHFQVIGFGVNKSKQSYSFCFIHIYAIIRQFL